MRKLLLFDRHHITLHGLLRAEEGSAFPKTCPPSKPDGPVFFADRPWESGCINWVSMRSENGAMRLWYEAKESSSFNDCDTRLCYAESRDGIHWEKPNLGICEYGGNRNNNIVIDRSVTGALGIHGHSIFVDPNASPESKYRCMFLCSVPSPLRDVGHLDLMSFAHSPDGLRWRLGLPEFPDDFLHFPITSFGSDTQCTVFWDEAIRKYVGYFRTWNIASARCIARSETNDLTSWPQPRTILAPDYLDPPLTDYYSNGATLYQSGGDRAYFLFYSPFDHNTEKCWSRVATSRDGIFFDRGDRARYIDNDRPYDEGMIFVSGGIHDLGNGESAVLSNSTGRRHCVGLDTPPIPHGPTLYRFPTDRIVGLETKSFYNFSVVGAVDPNAPEVFVNAAVNGKLRAGLISDNKFLEGFSPDDCEPLSGDLRGVPFRWKGKSSPVTEAYLKLFLEDGTIFSVTVNK